MVIGTSTDLRNIAKKILLKTENTPETVDENFPSNIYSTEVDIPAEHSLSFHIETATKENPKGSSSESQTVKFLVLVFAIIGVIQILKSVLSFAL